MATPPKDPTDGAPPPAPKPPAPRKPATPRKTTTRKAAAPAAAKTTTRKAPTPDKPASTAKPAAKPAAATTAKKPAAKRAPAARKAPAAASGSKWGMAAVIGGVGAALTAGLLALKGSMPTVGDTAKSDPGKSAHQPDGVDSSKSFAAGIADEGTIPE